MPEVQGAPVATPLIGSVWRHHKGGRYIVLEVSNTLRGNDKFPVRVVYMDPTGNVFSRDLEAWHERYVPEDRLNHYELQSLSVAALDIQAVKSRVQMVFLGAVNEMSRRLGAQAGA